MLEGCDLHAKYVFDNDGWKLGNMFMTGTIGKAPWLHTALSSTGRTSLDDRTFYRIAKDLGISLRRFYIGDRPAEAAPGERLETLEYTVRLSDGLLSDICSSYEFMSEHKRIDHDVNLLNSKDHDAGETIESRTEKALYEANDAFWAVIAKAFPECKSGDFAPIPTLRFDEAQKAAVETWLDSNLPRPDEQAPEDGPTLSG